MANAQARMDEDAQAALTILAQQVRLAGVNPAQGWTDQLNYSTYTTVVNPVYLPYEQSFATPTYADPPYTKEFAGYQTPTYSTGTGPAYVLSKYALFGCSSSFADVNVANLDDLACNSDTTLPNSFGVSYEADSYNTVAGIADPSIPTDCLGDKLSQIDATIPQPPPEPAPASSSSPAPSSTSSAPASSSSAPIYTSPAVYEHAKYYRADNRFYIKSDTQSDNTTVPSLYCRGNGTVSSGTGTAEQPLIQNVENMQITYGMQSPDQNGKPDTGSTTVAGYLDAKGVASAAGFTTDYGRWHKVIVVRICLQMRSANRVMANAASASYIKCDGTLQTAPPDSDLRLRRVYTTTVVLRNRLL
jgi:type IV pilus assembly protein PilW